MFDKMDVGRSITYRRNPDYWGKALPINIGQNNFDTIRFEYFSDPTLRSRGSRPGFTPSATRKFVQAMGHRL